MYFTLRSKLSNVVVFGLALIVAVAVSPLASDAIRTDQYFFNGLQLQKLIFEYRDEVVPRPDEARPKLPQFFQMLSSMIAIHEFQARDQDASEGIQEAFQEMLDVLKNDSQELMKILLNGKFEDQTYSDMKLIEEYLKLYSTVKSGVDAMIKYKRPSEEWCTNL